MFTLDSKIVLNKERLEKLRSEIQGIQNINTLYLIYLGFIGLYFFDFTERLIILWNQEVIFEEWKFFLSYGLAIFLLAVSVFYFIQLVIPKYVAHDLLPKEVYNDLKNEVQDWIQRKGVEKDIEIETKESYLETLEDAVSHNFDLYIEKKRYAFRLIIFALLSLIPYIIAILTS